jgi:type II secretory pathway component PulF
MGGAFRVFLVWLFVWFLPTVALIVALYSVATYPLRRRERARVFLDLLSSGLREGRSIEQTIISVAESRDRSLGVRFYLLAAYLEQGLRFDQALAVASPGLPPQIVAVLQSAPEAGGLEKLLPAAKRILTDASSRAHSSMNYLVLALMLFTPGLFAALPMWRIFVWPKMQQIIVDLEIQPPLLTQIISENVGLILCAYGLLILLYAEISFSYLANPEYQKRRSSFRDRFSWKIPWIRKRGLRNFSLMLATFLDSNVPEATALKLAGDATANGFFIGRCQSAIDKLAEGNSLKDVVKELDQSGELSWRLSNAAHGKHDFLRSLEGWHETLESKAFQAEQTAAHLITSSFIIFNGIFIGAFVCSVFLVITSVINEGTLW